MSEVEHELYYTDIPAKTVTLVNEKTTMNLLGRLALTLALQNSSGCIHTKPINCYILEGIETTQIILSWPDLVTHFVDLSIGLIKSANKHIDAINMISLTNHRTHPAFLTSAPTVLSNIDSLAHTSRDKGKY